jgi:hypothetical protein
MVQDTHYRLYCLDGIGKISAAEWLAADDDENAIRSAKDLKKNVPCELWDRNRLVARIPAFEEDPAAKRTLAPAEQRCAYGRS